MTMFQHLNFWRPMAVRRIKMNDKLIFIGVMLSVISLIIISVFSIVNRPASVVLDEKHFTCTDAVPDGLGTKCINYHWIGVK